MSLYSTYFFSNSEEIKIFPFLWVNKIGGLQTSISYRSDTDDQGIFYILHGDFVAETFLCVNHVLAD